MSDNISLSVDGMGISKHPSVERTEFPNSSNFELGEIRRKLEKKDIELKKRDKEVTALQRELKALGKEMHNLRENNALLQQSLNYFREDVDKRMDHGRIITELEGELILAENKLHEKASEMEFLIKSNAELLQQSQVLSTEMTSKDSQKKLLEHQLEITSNSLHACQSQLNDRDSIMANLQKELENAKKTGKEYKGLAEHEQSLLNLKDLAISELKEEVRKLKGTLVIRNETNSVLRSQLEELRNEKIVLSREEMENYQKSTQETKAMQDKIKELAKQVDRHVELLRRAEEEGSTLKDKLDEVVKSNQLLKEEAERKVHRLIDEELVTKAFKKEIIELKKTKKSLLEKLESTRAILINKNNEIESIRKSCAEIVKQKELENKGIHNERKRRKVADEAARSLRGRVSYLLEQLQQALSLTVSWQEQKSVLKAEVCSLHRANLDLRKRLVAIQRHYLSRNLSDLAIRCSGGRQPGGNYDMLSSPSSPSSPFANLTTAENFENIGETYDDIAPNSLPTTAEAEIERCLFDTICAFTSGDRRKLLTQGNNDTQNKNKEKDKQDLTALNGSGGGILSAMNAKISLNKGAFKIAEGNDGLYQIREDSNNNNEEENLNLEEFGYLQSAELLESLKIHSFLKFVQTRVIPEKRLISLFVERIVNLLNFTRRITTDAVSQIMEARLQRSKLQAQIGVAMERVDLMRGRLSCERLSKHKAVLKFVQERIRQSDVRVAINELEVASRRDLTQAEEYVENKRQEALRQQQNKSKLLREREQPRRSSRKFDDTDDDVAGVSSFAQRTKVILGYVQTLSENLAKIGLSGSSSSVVGGIELRLQQLKLDDETLHSVIGLISGNLTGEGDEDANAAGAGGNTGVLMNSEVIEDTRRIVNELGAKLSGSDVMAHAQLAKKLLASGSGWINRIVMMNLSDNILTDLSCKLLVPLLENSHTIRLLDLRVNLISSTGAKYLYEAVRQNSSVLLATQGVDGFVIEGHREIVASNVPRSGTSNDIDFNSLGVRDVVGSGHTLYVDMRQCNNKASEDPAVALMLLEDGGGWMPGSSQQKQMELLELQANDENTRDRDISPGKYNRANMSRQNSSKGGGNTYSRKQSPSSLLQPYRFMRPTGGSTAYSTKPRPVSAIVSGSQYATKAKKTKPRSFSARILAQSVNHHKGHLEMSSGSDDLMDSTDDDNDDERNKEHSILDILGDAYGVDLGTGGAGTERSDIGAEGNRIRYRRGVSGDSNNKSSSVRNKGNISPFYRGSDVETDEEQKQLNQSSRKKSTRGNSMKGSINEKKQILLQTAYAAASGLADVPGQSAWNANVGRLGIIRANSSSRKLRKEGGGLSTFSKGGLSESSQDSGVEEVRVEGLPVRASSPTTSIDVAPRYATYPNGNKSYRTPPLPTVSSGIAVTSSQSVRKSSPKPSTRAESNQTGQNTVPFQTANSTQLTPRIDQMDVLRTGNKRKKAGGNGKWKKDDIGQLKNKQSQIPVDLNRLNPAVLF